jgi:hypothetical protein
VFILTAPPLAVVVAAAAKPDVYGRSDGTHQARARPCGLVRRPRHKHVLARAGLDACTTLADGHGHGPDTHPGRSAGVQPQRGGPGDRWLRHATRAHGDGGARPRHTATAAARPPALVPPARLRQASGRGLKRVAPASAASRQGKAWHGPTRPVACRPWPQAAMMQRVGAAQGPATTTLILAAWGPPTALKKIGDT